MAEDAENFRRASSIAHVPPLDSLRRKVDVHHAALIVVDVQNDFCAHGGLLATEGRDVTDAQRAADRLPEFIASARQAGALVIFIRSVYTTEGNLYLSDSWLEHAARRRPGGYTRIPACAAGSWGGDFYGDVRPQPNDPVVSKHRYSGFYNTDLDTILRANGIRTLVMTGVATNVCVESTARDGFMRDYYVVLVEDGTASYSSEEHKMAVSNIDRYFGQVSSIAQITAIWREQNDKKLRA
jgi:ureidoacrylate peracid hydrolase